MFSGGPFCRGGQDGYIARVAVLKFCFSDTYEDADILYKYQSHPYTISAVHAYIFLDYRSVSEKRIIYNITYFVKFN